MCVLMSDISEQQTLAAAWFRTVRDSICAEFEAIEGEGVQSAASSAPFTIHHSPSTFTLTPWSRPDGGSGEMGMMKGRVFEKVGVNISVVHGEFSEAFRKEIPGAESDPRFWAAGISLVAHPMNPHVPAAHMNTRMIAVGGSSPHRGEVGRGASQGTSSQLSPPPNLPPMGGGILRLYRDEAGVREQFGIGGQYAPVSIPDGSLMLEDIKRASKPVAKGATAQLWDLGDGVACMELTSKQNTWDPENLKFIGETIGRVQRDFKGLVIGTDAEHFSFGANIGFFLLAANSHSWWAIEDMVTSGQQAFMGLKYAPFPVVSSLSGMALGGGCELQLHVDAVQAHEIDRSHGLSSGGRT